MGASDEPAKSINKQRMISNRSCMKSLALLYCIPCPSAAAVSAFWLLWLPLGVCEKPVGLQSSCPCTLGHRAEARLLALAAELPLA
jgi:hypothetical protein